MRRLLLVGLLFLCVPAVFAQNRHKDRSQWDRYIMRVVTLADTGVNAPLQQLTDAAGKHVSLHDLVKDLVQSRKVAIYNIDGSRADMTEQIRTTLMRPQGVNKYILFEKWTYNTHLSKLQPQLLAIGPYDSVYASRDGYMVDLKKNADCSAQEFQPMFFVKYVSLKPILANYTVVPKGKQAGKPVTADTYIGGNMFVAKMTCVNEMSNEGLGKAMEAMLR